MKLLEIVSWASVAVLLTLALLIVLYFAAKMVTFGVLQAHKRWKDDQYKQRQAKRLGRHIDKFRNHLKDQD